MDWGMGRQWRAVEPGKRREMRGAGGGEGMRGQRKGSGERGARREGVWASSNQGQGRLGWSGEKVMVVGEHGKVQGNPGRGKNYSEMKTGGWERQVGWACWGEEGMGEKWQTQGRSSPGHIPILAAGRGQSGGLVCGATRDRV